MKISGYTVLWKGVGKLPYILLRYVVPTIFVIRKGFTTATAIWNDDMKENVEAVKEAASINA